MEFIRANKNAYGGTRPLSDIKYIVIHYTSGDKDTALNEANYFANGNTRKAGAHFFVDQNGVRIKSVAMKNIAWSVGGAKYSDCAKTGGGKLYGKCTNANSVSIELCGNLKRDPSDEQIESVKKVINYIRKNCPNAKTIVRHFDVTGKYCPVRMMEQKKWDDFLIRIGEKNARSTSKQSKKTK